jgi:hypothetical protein
MPGPKRTRQKAAPRLLCAGATALAFPFPRNLKELGILSCVKRATPPLGWPSGRAFAKQSLAPRVPASAAELGSPPRVLCLFKRPARLGAQKGISGASWRKPASSKKAAKSLPQSPLSWLRGRPTIPPGLASPEADHMCQPFGGRSQPWQLTWLGLTGGRPQRGPPPRQQSRWLPPKKQLGRAFRLLKFILSAKNFKKAGLPDWRGA